MRPTLLLADHAEVANGKLFINGGGWTFTGPQPVPFAIAMYIEVPWDQANTKHSLLLELLDGDGASVTVEDPTGQQRELRVEMANFEVGRPAGVKPGTPLGVPFAMNFGPIPLEPGCRYVWRLSIDGHHEEDWRLAFSTRPKPPQALAA
jgi:hypothetical protein